MRSLVVVLDKDSDPTLQRPGIAETAPRRAPLGWLNLICCLGSTALLCGFQNDRSQHCEWRAVDAQIVKLDNLLEQGDHAGAEFQVNHLLDKVIVLRDDSEGDNSHLVFPAQFTLAVSCGTLTCIHGGLLKEMVLTCSYWFAGPQRLWIAGLMSEWLREMAPQGILERRCEVRWTVPTPTPSSAAIARQDAPDSRSFSTRDSSMAVRGRPSFLPFALALRKPAFTRS